MRQRIIDALYSIGFALTLAVSIIYFRTLWWSGEDYVAGLKISYINWRVLVLVCVFVYFCYKAINKLRIKVKRGNIFEDCTTKNATKIFYHSLGCSLLVWSIWFMVFAPGAGMNDTLNIFMSEYKSNNQPIIYQILVWYGMKIFKYLSEDMTWAYGCLVLLQMLFCAYVFASVLAWLSKKGISQTILNILVLYYSMLPIVADYSITLVKDTLFAVFLLLFIICLYDIADSKGQFLKNNKNFIRTVVALVGICCLRNNGVIVCLASLIIVMFLKFSNKKQICLLMIIVLLTNAGISFLEQARFGTNVKFREAIGVPLVQIGAVLNDDNANLTDTDLKELSNLLPVEVWKENYRPSFADKIKFCKEFDNSWLNENKILFIKIWTNVLMRNFPIYVKAYICHSYGYWGVLPYPPDMSQSYFTKINNNTGGDSIWGKFCEENQLQNHTVLPKQVSNVLDKIFRMAFKANMLFTPGLMIWLVFLCVAILLGEKMYLACVPCLPIIFTWGTMMIASPASLIYRYSYYLVLTLPVVIILTIGNIQGKGNEHCEKTV